MMAIVEGKKESESTLPFLLCHKIFYALTFSHLFHSYMPSPKPLDTPFPFLQKPNTNRDSHKKTWEPRKTTKNKPRFPNPKQSSYPSTRTTLRTWSYTKFSTRPMLSPPHSSLTKGSTNRNWASSPPETSPKNTTEEFAADPGGSTRRRFATRHATAPEYGSAPSRPPKRPPWLTTARRSR